MMKLNLESISSLACGVLKTSETPEGLIHFDRLPDSLLPVYKNNEGAVTRLLCPAAVRLRFCSDTSSIRIALRYFTSARAIFKGSISIDGKEPEVFGPDEACERWEGEIYRTKGSGEHQVEIWMPHLCHSEIEFLEVDDSASLKPAPTAKYRWLAYGDSITQGMTVTNPAEAWVAIAARKVDAGVLNLGVGGAKVVSEMANAIPDYDYDFASIAYGTNDFNQGVPVEDYEANLRSLIEALKVRYPGKPVFLISVIPWAERTEPNKNGDLISAYRTAAERIADEIEGVVKVSGPSLIDDNPDLFVDNVHPNETGMAMYGDNFANAVAKVI